MVRAKPLQTVSGVFYNVLKISTFLIRSCASFAHNRLGPVNPPKHSADAADGAHINPRVLVYGMNHAPEMVGIGRYTADIVSELVSRGRQVTIVTAQPHYPFWSTRPWRDQGARNRYSRET